MVPPDELKSKFANPIRPLNVDAARIWRDLLPLLAERGNVELSDLWLFADYCEMQARAQRLSMDIDLRGETIQTRRGDRLNPSVNAYDRAINTAMRLADRLGIGPKARMQLERKSDAGSPEEEFDKFCEN